MSLYINKDSKDYALTGNAQFIEFSEPLVVALSWHIITQANSTKRDEAEIEGL